MCVGDKLPPDSHLTSVVQLGGLCWQSENRVVANTPRSGTIHHVLTGVKGGRGHQLPSQSTPRFKVIVEMTPDAFAPTF